MENLNIYVRSDEPRLYTTLKETLTGQTAYDDDFNTIITCRYGDVNIQFSYWYMNPEAIIYIYDVSDRSSFERAIHYIESIRKRYSVLLLAARRPGSSVTVDKEEGARVAEKQRCGFGQVDPPNREEALASIERLVEEIIEKNPELLRRMLQAKKRTEQQLDAEALACGIKLDLFKSLKSAKTNIEDILEFGVEENYHVRVMVVGKEGVGKSTLTRRLVQLPVDIKQYNSTDGIEVHVRRCEVDLDNGTWTTLNEKSRLEKFKGIFKRGKTTDAATGDDRDFHQRVAKVLQTADQSSVSGSKRVPSSNSSELTILHMKTESATTIEQHEDVPKTTPSELRSSKPAVTAEDMEMSLQKAKNIRSKGKGRKAKIDFYDFAGQEIFHASHPTFMSSKAIFILVFKLLTMYEELISKSQDGTVEQQLEFIFNNPESNIGSMLFWLYTIYMHSSRDTELSPHVLLVGTNADKIPRKDRDAIIKQCFDGFRNYIVGLPFNSMLAKTEFAVDNTKKNNPVFNAIKKKIFELGKTLPNWGKETPTKWLPLDREIQSLKDSGQKVLTVEQLKDINRSLKLRLSGEEEMTVFLQFLHDSGEIIYFCQEGLKNIIVLDPVWMIDALKTIITAEAFAIRKPGLDVLWRDFRNSGIISKSAIVNIFKENDNDKSLYDNHEHVIRLMEKFLYIASPLKFSEETTDATTHGAVGGVVLDQRDVNFIMPCMVNKKADSGLLTNDEGKSSTTVFCMMTDTKFLPPIVFHKLLAICITQWPIVEQNGQKMIFSETCRFNIDRQGSYKLTIFFLKHGIRFRIISFVDNTQPDITICQNVMEFLTSNFKSVLQTMGFSDLIMTYIQCPQFLPTQSGGLLETGLMENQKHVTCDECQKPHGLETSKILGCWVDTGPEEDETGLKNAQGSLSVAESDVLEPEDSDAPITQEHINHTRLCNALVTVCAAGLRQVLQREIPQGCPSFYQLLLANEAKLRAMKQFRQEQLNILYPDPQKNFTGTLDQFDLTLIYSLVRNISTVQAPVTGWGQPPNDNPRDTSLGASVERIRRLRNTVVGHSVDYRVDSQVFEDTWQEMSQTMNDIENIIGYMGFATALKERKHQQFTVIEARQVQKEFKRDIESVIESLEETSKKLKAILENT